MLKQMKMIQRTTSLLDRYRQEGIDPNKFERFGDYLQKYDKGLLINLNNTNQIRHQ